MLKTKIIIAGDTLPMPCNYDLFSAGDTKALFGDRLCELFASADYRVCNLEGCFTDCDTPIDKIGPAIHAPTASIKGIKALGIDYATLGNTHSMDYGVQGYHDTCKTLTENGIGHFGWGDNENEVKSSVTIEHAGRRIVLYNTTECFENAPGKTHPGVNLYDEYRVLGEIKALKESCDYLIVFYHGGIEGTHYNSDIMRRRFHRMADNGADVVLSQHTHAIGEEERYNGAYLLYGQGNFCFHFRPQVTPLLAEGLVLELDFDDRSFTAKPHRILRTEKGCVYDDKQELEAFYARSKTHDALLAGDDTAAKEFRESFGKDCMNWMSTFFWAMRGNNPEDDEKRASLSPGEFAQYLKASYSRKQLLGIQMFLRNEEFNEVGNQILSDLLRESNTKEITNDN
ncbi:MAG: CapA family protein [Ruminococcus sp.]|nr:CapA family protein [Ruminococcus sp.]